MMKRHVVIAVLFIGVLLLFGTERSDAASLLVSKSQYPYGGYGGTDYNNMTSALDTATGNNVSVVSSFDNLTTMLSYDAIWLDPRTTIDTLSTTEVSNITSFIATGRKAVLVGENQNWNNWNNQLMDIVGGTYSGNTSGNYANTIASHDLTNGVSQVYLQGGGKVVSGGAALFDQNFATMWNDNVLTVLDLGIHTDSFWSFADNAQFATNVANWVVSDSFTVPEPIPTVVPEPISFFLFIIGGATFGFRRIIRKKIRT